MKIININTQEIPCPGSHYWTANKFCDGFVKNGFDFLEINTLENIEQYNTSDNIFLLSNHFVGMNNQRFVYEIGSKLENCYFICWHFNFEKDLLSNMPFKKYIITGEYYRNPPTSSQYHIDAYNFSNKSNDWIPFKFSSSLHPDEVGSFKKDIIYDSSFIGAPYKQNWATRLNNCFNYTSDSYKRFLSESERVDAYLKSRVCLGFHSDGNIQNSCIVERVFEGMAYGCAVVTDNKSAEDITGGIVKYVESFEELNSYIGKCNNDHEFFSDIQKRGYEWIKKEGTYYHLAKEFIDKIKK